MKEIKKMKIVWTVLTVLLAVMLVSAAVPAFASEDMNSAQGIVAKARVTFNDFMNDSRYTWLHEHMKNAKGLLIFPQVLKAGFILGGSGGTGVLVLKNEKT